MVGCAEHLQKAGEAARRCVTLVKDTRHNLPIDPARQKRAGFTVDVAPNFHDLEVANGPGMANMMAMMDCGRMEEFRAKYDVVFLVINVKGYAQENNVRLR